MKKTLSRKLVSVILLVVLALSTLTLNANAGLFQFPDPPLNDDFDHPITRCARRPVAVKVKRRASHPNHVPLDRYLSIP